MAWPLMRTLRPSASRKHSTLARFAYFARSISFCNDESWSSLLVREGELEACRADRKRSSSRSNSLAMAGSQHVRKCNSLWPIGFRYPGGPLDEGRFEVTLI